MESGLVLAQFATLTGGAALVVALVEVVKRTLNWNDQVSSRFSPLTAIILGIAIACLIALARTPPPQGNEWIEPLFGGLVIGLYACGLYSAGGKNIVNAAAGER